MIRTLRTLRTLRALGDAASAFWPVSLIIALLCLGVPAPAPAQVLSGPPDCVTVCAVQSLSLGDGIAGAPSLSFASDPDTGIWRNGANDMRFSVNGAAEFRIAAGLGGVLNAARPLSWGSSGVDTPDLSLYRDAAATLRLGAADAAAPVAQTITVQDVVAGTTDTAGATLTIAGSRGTGTGAGGAILLQTAPAAGGTGSSQNALTTALNIGTGNISAARNLIFSTDNLHNIGASGANRPALIYFATSAIADPTGSYQWSARTRFRSPADGVLTISNNAETDFSRLQFGGTTSSFPALKRSGANLEARLADDSARTYIYAAGFIPGAAGQVQWEGRTILTSPADGNLTITNAAATNSATITVGAANLLTLNGGLQLGGGFVSGGQVVAAGSSAIRWNSSSQLFGQTDGNITLYNNAASDFSLLQFGGTTSAFPALRRSGAGLQARLADNSGFATLQGRITTENAYVATPQTPTGYIIIYDNTGTAYKVSVNP